MLLKQMKDYRPQKTKLFGATYLKFAYLEEAFSIKR
jgi:hypothetical protein